MRLSVHDVWTRGAVSDGLCVGSAALLTCCGCHSTSPALSFAAVKPINTTTLIQIFDDILSFVSSKNPSSKLKEPGF